MSSSRGPAAFWSDGAFADCSDYDDDDYLSEGEVAMFDESEVVDLVTERANAAAKAGGKAPTMGDEALARALASQRSERLSVAQRRALEEEGSAEQAGSSSRHGGAVADFDDFYDPRPARAQPRANPPAPREGGGSARKRPMQAPAAGKAGAASKRRAAAPSRAAQASKRPAGSNPWVEDDVEDSATEEEEMSYDDGAGGFGGLGGGAVGGAEEEEEEGEEDGEDADERVPGLRVPGKLWRTLFEHQRTCLQWLWELHQQEVALAAPAEPPASPLPPSQDIC